MIRYFLACSFHKSTTLLLTVQVVFLCSSVLHAQEAWTLRSCLDTAYHRNIALRQTKVSSQSNMEILNQARAGLLPNLNIIDGHNLNSGYSLDPYTYQYTNQKISVNNLSLTSVVTLFNGYLLLNTIRQNKLIYQAGTQDIEKSKNDIMLSVVAGYMQVLMDYEAIDVAQAQVKATRTQVEQTTKFVTFGKVAELNLLQVQSQLATDKLTLVNAETQLHSDKVTLLQLMNIPLRNDFDIVRQNLDDLFPEASYSPEELFNISNNSLPDVKSARLKTQASLFSLKMAKSAWFPKLMMTGYLKSGYSSLRSNITQNTSYESQTIGYLNNIPTEPVIGMIPVTTINKQNSPFEDQLKNTFSQTISLTLSIPIFNNRQSKTNVALARLNVTNAQLNEQQVQSDLRKAIETAYTNQLTAAQKLIATEEQMKLEERTYRDMEKKYGVGVMNATDFLIEKNNYNKVSMSLIQARYDYVLKVKMVDFYAGKLLIF